MGVAAAEPLVVAGVAAGHVDLVVGVAGVEPGHVGGMAFEQRPVKLVVRHLVQLR